MSLYIVGLILLILNLLFASFNILVGNYYMLPVSAVGVYFAIDIMQKAIRY